MLHILFTILKIIGIILLAILGILILLLLIVLFVPLRYQIQVETKGDLKSARLNVKFSWLLNLFAGKVSYIEEKLDWQMRILWKKITPGEEVEERSSDSEAVPEKAKAEKTEIEAPKAEKKAEEKSQNKEESKPEEADTEEESKFQKFKCTIQKVCDKIKLVLAFLKGKEHQAAFRKVKEELIRLVMFLKPKKLNGKIRFGMEDPYQTGQILAVLSVLYPLYAENVEIYPDFEEKVIDGNLYIKGHIRVIYAVIVAFNIIIDKHIRTTIKDIKALL